MKILQSKIMPAVNLFVLVTLIITVAEFDIPIDHVLIGVAMGIWICQFPMYSCSKANTTLVKNLERQTLANIELLDSICSLQEENKKLKKNGGGDWT